MQIKRGNMNNPISIRKSSRLCVILVFFISFLTIISMQVAAKPCEIRQSGCYKTGDVLSGFGELLPEEFGYFLPENKCIKVGNCNCQSTPSDIAEQTDPDSSSGACVCIAGSDWNVNGKCCGNDESDCGQITSGALCSIDQYSTFSSWIESSSNVGDIRYVGCSEIEYVSDGISWRSCANDSAPFKFTIAGSEYMCKGEGRESIIECCGDGPCKSIVDGKRISTGQSVVDDTANVTGASPNPVLPVATPSADITSNLVLHWKFDEASGNTASDSSGNGNDGTLQGAELPAWTSGKVSNALSFPDGKEDYVIKNPISGFPTDEITTAFWIKTSDAQDGIISYAVAGLYGDNIWLIESSDDITLHRNTFFGTRATGIAVNDGQWHFVAATWRSSDGETKLYKDGSLVYTSPKPLKKGKFMKTGGSLVIGQDQDKVGNSFDVSEDFSGILDEVRIYSKALNEGQIKAIYDYDIKSTGSTSLQIINELLPEAAIGRRYFAVITAEGHGTTTYQWSVSGNLPPGLSFNPSSYASAQYSQTAIIEGTPTVQGSYPFVITVSDGSDTFSKGFNIQVSTHVTQLTTTYYCRTDRIFVTDLDTPESHIGDEELNNKNKATCEKAGFEWTGTKCCSEADDINEYYNDAGGTGGCWNSTPIISISFVDGTNESVINYGGEFHGCAVDKSNFNAKNNYLLNLTDIHSGAPLITNNPYCTSDQENNYYCSYAEKWLPTDGLDKTHLSYAPIKGANKSAECCGADECWDGKNCIANQKSDPLAQPLNGSRCIDGAWVNSTLKFTPDDELTGYCPENTQCLVNVFGADEDAQCIENGEYFDDNYCENGIWSSRTKLLALKLLKLKTGDYTLFCSNRETALNNLQYMTGSGEIVENVLKELQTNNFCILKASGKIIAATSINRNLNEVPSTSWGLLGVTDCSSAFINDSQYHPCDSTNKVWFNMGLKSFIYSATPISIPTEQNLLSSFEQLISNPIKGIISSIKRLISSPPYDESYARGIKKFNSLYMAQQGATSITGAIEGKNFKNAVIQYSGFDADICQFVDQFNTAKKDAYSGVSCKKEGSTYYVLAQGSKLTNLNPESIWPDLTSKLRLK